jgi:hypothetical protein
MLKSLTFAIVIASAVAGLGAIPATAAGRTTAAQCQALYDQSRLDPQSYRNTRDEYISCVSNL